MKEVMPEFHLTAFSCPHCGVLCKQHWTGIKPNDGADHNTKEKSLEDLLQNSHLFPRTYSATCAQCTQLSIWVDEKMVYPRATSAPDAHPLMPEECKSYYNEARLVAQDSPRAAAALLRLTIEKLVCGLDVKSKKLNDAIGELVTQGLPEKVQKALDTCRVIGNEAVHSGTIIGDDTNNTTNSLFFLINFIVEKMIEEPLKVDEIFDMLPESKKQGIEQRDRKKAS